MDELLALDDETLSGYLMVPPVPEQRDERRILLAAMLPELLRQPDRKHVTRRVLWEEYCAEQPDGYGYTQFCEHPGRNLKTREAFMHLEHKPGEEPFFKFAVSARPTPCLWLLTHILTEDVSLRGDSLRLSLFH